MKASVIIPIYRDNQIDLVLQSLERQVADREDYEIIFVLVNAANAEVIAARILYYRIPVRGDSAPPKNWKIVYNFGGSNCASRNHGARIASGDTLVFADGDQIFAENFITEHIKAAQPNTAAIGVINMAINFTDQAHYFLGRHYEVKNLGRENRPIDVINGLSLQEALKLSFWHHPDKTDCTNFITRNCSIWADSFRALGGFDEEFGFSPTSKSRGWEDVELGLRAHRAGVKFVFAPCWTVHINHEGMNKDNGRINAGKLARKHPWFAKQHPEWFKQRYGNIL